MAEVGSSLSLLIHGYANILRVGRDAQDFIKDDLPANANPINKWGQEVLRRSCRRFARANVPGIGVVNSPIWGSVCDPYLNSINEGPTSQGNYGPPFTGGQCSALYRVDFTNQLIDKNTGAIVNTQIAWSLFNGPILGTIDCQGASCGIPGLPTPAYQSWLISGSLSASGETSGMQKIIVGNKRYIAQGFSGTTSTQRSTMRINSVTIQSGTDTCGNLPTIYTPPTYPTNLPALPTPTNPAPGLGNGWDVTVNPDGTFNICIGSECTPNINPDGSGPDTGEDPGEPEGPPQENDPNDPNDNRISGCVGEGKILTGIKISFTQVPTNVSGPLDYYRNVAIIGFGPDSDRIDLVKDGSLMIDGQFVIPDSDFCRCYRLDITPGWGLSVQAYSRPEKTE